MILQVESDRLICVSVKYVMLLFIIQSSLTIIIMFWKWFYIVTKNC